jgi:hypothetical protein
MKSTSFWHCVMSMGRRLRAYTELSGPTKAMTTRDYVRGISGPSTLLNTFAPLSLHRTLLSTLIPELLDLTRGKDVKKNFHVESCVNLKLRHSLLQSPGGSEAHTGIAFEKLKCAFTGAPVLAHLDPTLETWMETDSSDTVTAGVLSQIQSGGVLRPSRVRRVKIRTVRN